ncbi:unnamed protein product [Closterium sp. NIES-53]
MSFADQIDDMSEAERLDKYVSGLKYEIQFEVRRSRPTSFLEAVRVAESTDALMQYARATSRDGRSFRGQTHRATINAVHTLDRPPKGQCFRGAQLFAVFLRELAVDTEGRDIAKLLLPDDWRIHDAFHVSLLRKFVPATTDIARQQAAPTARPVPEPTLDPSKILAHRVRLDAAGRHVDFLIRWTGRTSEDDTWVPSASLDASPLIGDYLARKRVSNIDSLS